MVPMIRASDLSRLSCRPFCRYHCHVSGTRGENGQPGRCVVGALGEMELCVVVVILVILYTVASDDVGGRAALDRKLQRSKVRHSHVDH